MLRKITILAIALLLAGSLEVEGKTSYSHYPQSEAPQARVKKGNVIGSFTLEIDLVVITIKYVEVSCDNMQDRICYEKRGEEAPSGVGGLLIPSRGELHEGVLVHAVQETNDSNGGTVVYQFDNSTYTLTILPPASVE